MECPPARNIKLVVAYDGTAYHGWQRQAAGIDTVQERVEQAAIHVLGHPLNVGGASRTDAGVHAEGQVANVRTSNVAIPLIGLRRAMNSRLPGDIVIRSAVEAPDDFDPSTSAIGKTYRYRICVSPCRPATLSRQVCHYWRPLEIEPMRQAAARVVGQHDFRGFATSQEQRENTVRTVFRCEVSEADGEIVVQVRGDGFLYNMVRNIVGTLIEVGRGRWQSDQIDRIFETLDRGQAGPTSPARGLTLMCVHYRDEVAGPFGEKR